MKTCCKNTAKTETVKNNRIYVLLFLLFIWCYTTTGSVLQIKSVFMTTGATQQLVWFYATSAVLFSRTGSTLQLVLLL